jgi:hypothetical protein
MEWQVSFPSPPPFIRASPACRGTHLLLDKDRRVVGALVGQPEEKSWVETCEGAYHVLSTIAKNVKPSQPGHIGRRGVDTCLTHGITLGAGALVCFSLLGVIPRLTLYRSPICSANLQKQKE